ncbi:2OG-Fe(II) oxygenase [Actinospica sp. MGRD01-02]|uniref:2OG-Fe(II) oxygenase n=1 Tax=Actinospica acidithermotolerans TaxID=2828514 RepID=A0A941EGI8_9ACTN|nr:2OG-Fe(II) oxygenase [Actinospica acidithermotolerans]MBR7831046.1 2OG-Fe(II) oxygenase [Actinospica acidithermotolerans]
MTKPPAEAGYADLVHLIDLERYPIHDLDSDRGRAFVEQCRQQLAEHGACSLPGFMPADAVTEMVRVAYALVSKAWRSDQTHTVYFEEPDDTVAPADPRAFLVRSAKNGIAYDYLPENVPVRRLYESDDLTSFIAAVLGKKALYRSADPLDAVQITLFQTGDELGWHFDRSEFSVTLMYQESESGGAFRYHPGLRSPEDENYEGVRRVLWDGEEEGVVDLPSAPGTLAFFHGRYAMHQVTPVTGETPRINSVLTYGERPDMRLNDLTSQLFYGRTSN